MRFLLTLSLAPSSSKIIPINYQYPISSWIYRTLSSSDAAYATWLHDKGYQYGKRFFKLFTFSNLKIPRCKAEGDRLRLLSDELQLQISFHAEEAVGNFIQGVFANQSFSLGDKKSRVDLVVRSVEGMPEPDFEKNSASFHCLSPVCISKVREVKGRIMPMYMHPQDEEYERLFFSTLIRQYLSSQKATADQEEAEEQLEYLRSRCSLQVLNEPKSRLITIKAFTPQETRVRGYLFDFRIEAPEEMIRFGYDAGFGEKGSLGMGMVEKC